MKYCILILLFVIIVFICLKTYKETSYKEGFVEGFEDRTLIISRYNEKLEWLETEPFSNYPYIVCNKGNDSSYLKTENFKKEIKINNIGKLAHTYLYYIIEDYDNLSKINIFLPNSLDDGDKMYRAIKLIRELDNKINTNKTNTPPDKYEKAKISTLFLYDISFPNMKEVFYNFQIDESLGMPETPPSKKVELSASRPFGKWYERFFGHIKTTHYCIYGIFSISKEDIKAKPKSYYEELIKEVQTSNPEQEQYFERAWEAIFYPLKSTDFFKYEIL